MGEILSAPERRRHIELVRGALPKVGGSTVGASSMDALEGHVVALEAIQAKGSESTELERLLGSVAELLRRLEPMADRGAQAIAMEAQAKLAEAEAALHQRTLEANQARWAHERASQELDLRGASTVQLAQALLNPRVIGAIMGGIPAVIAAWEAIRRIAS